MIYLPLFDKFDVADLKMFNKILKLWNRLDRKNCFMLSWNDKANLVSLGLDMAILKSRYLILNKFEAKTQINEDAKVGI